MLRLLRAAESITAVTRRVSIAAFIRFMWEKMQSFDMWRSIMVPERVRESAL